MSSEKGGRSRIIRGVWLGFTVTNMSMQPKMDHCRYYSYFKKKNYFLVSFVSLGQASRDVLTRTDFLSTFSEMGTEVWSSFLIPGEWICTEKKELRGKKI